MKALGQIVISATVVAIGALLMLPFGSTSEPKALSSDAVFIKDILRDSSQIILPIPQQLDLDPAKIKLGEQLFSDPDLSSNGFSCVTCHPLDRGGMDGLTLSATADGGVDAMNTPTIFNSVFNAFQLWNGKAESLEAQLDGVINNPRHMASSWPTIISRLSADKQYQRAFSSVYADGISKQSIVDAIISFEHSLITPNGDFDRFLNGDPTALTEAQKEGFQLFQQYGCSSCHQGINVGGNLFARFGIFENGQSAKEQLNDYDYGRFIYTQAKKDRFVFRVPSLRNVAQTAPYFHDGSADTLKQAITTMARVQLNIELADPDAELIEAFLHSLSGEYRGKKL